MGRRTRISCFDYYDLTERKRRNLKASNVSDTAFAGCYEPYYPSECSELLNSATTILARLLSHFTRHVCFSTTSADSEYRLAPHIFFAPIHRGLVRFNQQIMIRERVNFCKKKKVVHGGCHPCKSTTTKMVFVPSFLLLHNYIAANET